MIDKEALSPAEIESLMAGAKSAPSTETRPTPKAEADILRQRLVEMNAIESATRPRDTAQVVECLARAVSDDFARSMSQSLRSAVTVTTASVARLTYGQFSGGLAAPRCVCLAGDVASGERFVVDLSVSILFPMIDRMLGGRGDSGPPMRRPLTEIEQRLAARVFGTLLTSLERTTRGDAQLTSRLQRVESDPRRLDAMPGDAAILLMTFEVVLGASRGTIDVALPTSLVERLDGVGPGASELIVYLADMKMPVDQARNLAVGDVIATNQSIDAPLTARVDGRSAMQVRAGSVKGRKAIRVA